MSGYINEWMNIYFYDIHAYIYVCVAGGFIFNFFGFLVFFVYSIYSIVNIPYMVQNNLI